MRRSARFLGGRPKGFADLTRAPRLMLGCRFGPQILCFGRFLPSVCGCSFLVLRCVDVTKDHRFVTLLGREFAVERLLTHRSLPSNERGSILSRRTQLAYMVQSLHPVQ